MSTRAVIRVVEPWGTTIDLYHHHDGYPEGVGFDLVRRIRDKASVNGYSFCDGEAFINHLVKDRHEEYEVTTGVHSDIEYFYLVEMPKVERGKIGVKCWELNGAFSSRLTEDGEYNLTDERRVTDFDERMDKAYAEYKANEAKVQAEALPAPTATPALPAPDAAE